MGRPYGDIFNQAAKTGNDVTKKKLLHLLVNTHQFISLAKQRIRAFMRLRLRVPFQC